jgi:hypothetical protein
MAKKAAAKGRVCIPLPADGSQLRPGNRALDYLFAHYQPMDDKLKKLINDLPRIADGLYSYAQESATNFLRGYGPNPLVRAGKGFMAIFSGARRSKSKALAMSIFDLQMTIVFGALSKHLDNRDIASVLVDALIFQATGFEAGSPTEEELMFGGTQNTRGIHKFQLAHQRLPHIGDIEAWTFGKEFSAIESGSPLDFVNIVAVSSFSLIMRVRASWLIKYILYGTHPTKQDEESLKTALDKQKEDLKKLSDSMVDSFPNTQGA